MAEESKGNKARGKGFSASLAGIAATARRRRGRVVALCYLLLAAFWLLGGLFNLVFDRTAPPVSLPMEAAALENLAPDDEGGEGAYVSQNEDPQIRHEALGIRGRLVLLEADFDRDPGEMDLYYAQKPGQGFSPAKRVFGRRVDRGSLPPGYLYALPPGRIEALRLDPGNQSGLGFTFTALTVNPPQPLSAYFLPGPRQLLAFLFLPALASCGIFIIIECIRKRV